MRKTSRKDAKAQRKTRKEEEKDAKGVSPSLIHSLLIFFLLCVCLCAFAPLREINKAKAQEPSPAPETATQIEAPSLEPAPEDPTKPAPLDGQDGRPLALDQFRPRSMLELPEHRPQRAKFPTVDVHVHMRHKLRQTPEALAEFVRLMDNQNIALCVSLDGQLGDSFREHTEFLWTDYRDRFVIFANIDWQGAGAADDPATWDCLRSDFGRRMAVALEDAKRQGASGLKIFKDLGLVYRDADGSLLKVDDPRWDPIWEACGRLGLPVLIHTADPAAFFEPVDRFNERWEELQRHPQWCCRGPAFPTQDELLAQLMRVVARHPKTTFIGAHVGNNAENLRQVAQWLDAYPNFYIEIAARIAELGRQPYSARELFMNYPDRILFGTDGPRDVGRLIPHWRMLETADEYFPYAEDQYPPQGIWNIYGLYLPDDVLRKVYYENACRLIPGVRERLERLQVAKK